MTELAARRAELDRLLAGEHSDPHRVLGIHATPAGAVVRALHPRASSASVALASGSVPMRLVDDRGLFEATVPASARDGYRLRFAGAGGGWEVEDPYRFLPTLGELDLHLIAEGRHERLWERLGARALEHQGVAGVAFAVWAPNARGVRLASDASFWDDRLHPMRGLGHSGIWELFVPGAEPGMRYKFLVVQATGRRVLKADPLARAAEAPPANASVVAESRHRWGDAAWLERRARRPAHREPLSIYEAHLGSWRRIEERGRWRTLTYREAGAALAGYCADMGFTHVELLPLAEHPLTMSWGYQVTGYYAPTSRYGSPDDLRAMVDALHGRGIGVLLDWVPAHFPKDDWALARFDGTALYEHADPRRGEHPDWGTYVFNYGRNEVRNFLIANARYWLDEFHIDGLRVDAVASMLYLDYSRQDGEWLPNRHGGRENLEAVSFLRELTETVGRDFPGALIVAEESTAWPGVTSPVSAGGLGFGFKWNMGWMHDTLDYFGHDPVHRRYHHHQLTFGLVYAFSESFVLPLSHDEVVHGKRSLLSRMPGDRWQRFATLRALLAWMWAHPGKKLLFMGGELGQEREWSEERSIDWELLADGDHAGLQRIVRDLNTAYRRTPALWERDVSPEGFSWLDAGDADQNVISFLRIASDGRVGLACVANLSPVVRHGFRVGLPYPGTWREQINSDSELYGGSNAGNAGVAVTEEVERHGQPFSALLTLPPLGVLWLTPPRP